MRPLTPSVTVLAVALASAATAQERGITYAMTGGPGLVEMPSALASPDATLGTTLSYVGGEYRLNLGFQAAPWLFASYGLGFVPDFYPDDSYSVRDFNLRWNIRGEDGPWPAFALGINDLTGGYHSGEYLVATKTISDTLRVTAGLGWGRMAGTGSFDNILGLDDRDPFDPTPNSNFSLSHLFHGPMAVFGGVEWAFADDYTLKVEYSTDDGYRDATGARLFDHNSPLNLGLTWRPNSTFHLSAAYMYGSTFGLSGTFFLNPARASAPAVAGAVPPPQPITPRTAAPTVFSPENIASLNAALASEGILLEGVEITGDTARIRYTNTQYRADAQAMGRSLRVLTGQLPASVSRFVLEPMREGIPLSRASFTRADLERWENRVGGTEAIAASRDLRDAAGGSAGIVPVAQQRFQWGYGPTIGQYSRGDGHPTELALGAQINASYAILPNVILSGEVQARLLSNVKDTPVVPNPDYPTVRRDGGFYGDDAPGISQLTLAWYDRPATNVYSRLSFGLLEAAYGGLSAELLYKPVDSRWAFGAEVDYVVKRDYDMLFSFEDYDTVSGHLSGYYDFENGYMAQVDVGRYLAGDWGATFSLHREFANGWRIGGFMAVTDMPESDYGSGAFTKGVTLTIPLDGRGGKPSRAVRAVNLDGPLRDGGARLNVAGRLYDTVRSAHGPDLDESWGRFWQ
ncbi:lipoprotein yjbH [Ketogulonicigenium robustum]|uniref:Lipoprotein yjbH n=1 Tax=Ketogulonicigenium robustum TaxID=92947 RepID=A0A1W6P2K7_9RHOB|nr:YjbH domain-containing protein [Ketogulonicigenium robustum]ARO15748.1 lipoprotein yjbH [Ketogulonicigenium robustum]